MLEILAHFFSSFKHLGGKLINRIRGKHAVEAANQQTKLKAKLLSLQMSNLKTHHGPAAGAQKPSAAPAEASKSAAAPAGAAKSSESSSKSATYSSTPKSHQEATICAGSRIKRTTSKNNRKARKGRAMNP
ncbi:MAG: hypothetical protein IPP74_07985 [Alphaproteobacteria bacterium]|nr:hypothetical protein [Alphaproteobacteria bacterium]